jgi:hypothetical protein
LELHILGILPFNATLSYSNNHIENPKPNTINQNILNSSKVVPFILNVGNITPTNPPTSTFHERTIKNKKIVKHIPKITHHHI